MDRKPGITEIGQHSVPTDCLAQGRISRNADA